MSSFNYIRLDPSKLEFRLLYPVKHQNVTQPRVETSTEEGSDEAPLRYTIETHSHINPPHYAALSYTWGDAKLKRPLILNGSTIEITKNLDIALRHLQILDDPPAALWVDSVCINQADNDEKAEQVQRMKSIYETASEVIIWLGPSEKNSDLVMDFLTELGKQACELGLPERTPQGHPKFPESQSDERLRMLNKTLIKFMERSGAILLIDALEAFVGRGWWSRVWVTQELAVAQKLFFVCGTKTTSFEYLKASMDFWQYNSFYYSQSNILHRSLQGLDKDEIFRRLSRSSALGAKAMLFYRLGYQRRFEKKDWTLCSLLIHACTITGSDQRLQATNERDYIYGLLGLFEDDKKVGIKVDYRKDWQQVYIEFAYVMISKGNVDLISLGQKSDFESSESLPSWTPDWRYNIWCPKEEKMLVRNFRSPFVATGAPMAQAFSASGKVIADSKGLEGSHSSNSHPSNSTNFICEPTSAILLKGFLVAKIEKTGELFIPMDTPGSDSIRNMARYISEISSFCRESTQLNRQHIIYTVEQLQQAPWRIPIRNLEMAGETRRLGLLPDQATTISYLRYRALTHMLKAYEAYKAFERIGAPSEPLEIEQKQKLNLLSTIWSMLVKSVLLAKAIYHLVRFWLQRQRYLARCTIWVYNRLRYLLVHILLLVRLVNLDTASTLDSKIARSWHDLDETKGELYAFTLISNHSIKPFLMEKGYVGVGTEFVAEGDMVCVLKGGTVPFVLRPRGKGRDGYWVVGEAFVYGIMDGEFVEGRKEDEMDSFILY